MRRLGQFLIRFIKEDEGPTAVEYAVMMALIIVVTMTSVIVLGTNNNKTFSYVATQAGKTGS